MFSSCLKLSLPSRLAFSIFVAAFQLGSCSNNLPEGNANVTGGGAGMTGGASGTAGGGGNPSAGGAAIGGAGGRDAGTAVDGMAGSAGRGGGTVDGAAGGAGRGGGTVDGAAGGAGMAGGTVDGAAGGGVGPDSSVATDSGPPPGGGSGFYRMERLNRGVVAVQTAGGVYVGWRMLGFEYNPDMPDSIAYSVYRDGTRIATVTNSTNYQDAAGTATAIYTVRAVVNGVEQNASEPAGVWAQNYLRIPLQVPPAGTTPSTCPTPNEGYTYSANDGSVGDVDGDGQYEIFVKWDPSNAKDNSQSGCTGNPFLDAYKLDGTRLWRIDLGPNIRAGAHYTQFIVYDFDGDGKAEMAVKTAPGTLDGTGVALRLGPAANDDDSIAYRSSAGYVLTGPEYLTVFNGQTGAEMATVNFDVPRGTVTSWGDDYGNRVDRFLATAAYLDDTGIASFVMARGYYTRTTLTAWNFRNGQLSQLWKFDSNVTPRDSANHSYTGQGAHSLSVANVDADPQQEIIYGAMAIDHNGMGKCSTGYNHGDALHVGDFIPSRPGLEVFMPNEDGTHPAYHVRDANTCASIVDGPVNGNDTGRAVAGDISPASPGAEMWASGGVPLLDCATGMNLGAAPSSINFLIWWEGDESRELEDGTSITKYQGSSLLSCTQCSSNNGTKSTPTLTADLTGDWREEIIWKESNSSALRLYTTTAVTERRIYTLMHDAQYRIAVSWQNVAYNQPPHPSFHIGNGMAAPPRPNMTAQ